MTDLAEHPANPALETRDLITVTSSDLNHRWGLLMAEVLRNDAVLRVINQRTRCVQGYITRDVPPDLAVVDHDGTREYLAVPRARARSRKLCPGCGVPKDVEDFAKNRARHDGREGICKECDGSRPRRGQVRAVPDGAA
jgi:hypothetical protein